MRLADFCFDGVAVGFFAHRHFKLEVGFRQDVDHGAVVLSDMLVAVYLVDAPVLLLELEVQSIVVDHVALCENIVLLLLLVLLDLQDRVLVADVLDLQLLGDAHVLVRLDHLAADLKRHGRVVVNQKLLHDLEDAVLADVPVVVRALLLVQRHLQLVVDLLGQGVVLPVVEGKCALLALPVEVVVDVFAALYHQNLLAVPDFWLDDDFGVDIEDGVLAVDG
jgi:hypothetical protein